MAKKAKSNIFCDGKSYEQGKVYKDEDVAHLDKNDFEEVADEEVKETVKPEEKNLGDEEKKTETTSEGQSNDAPPPTPTDAQEALV